jgi:ADP-ribose pyrophosphatase YjhB (NUDIX family)
MMTRGYAEHIMTFDDPQNVIEGFGRIIHTPTGWRLPGGGVTTDHFAAKMAARIVHNITSLAMKEQVDAKITRSDAREADVAPTPSTMA